jgi:quinol monooxygenase YgiN
MTLSKLSRVKFCMLLLVANFLGVMKMSHAAEPITEKVTSYIVTYFEVYSSDIVKTKLLLKELTDSSIKEDGNLRFEVVQRIGQPDQFAILEAWRDISSMTQHQKSEKVTAIKEKLNVLLRSSYDERPHSALQVGKVMVPHAELKNSIFAITHVDIVPTIKDQGIALVKDISTISPKDSGNIRFEALTQISRPNHMTIVEIWANEDAIKNHASQKHKKDFRVTLTPMSGSLYDERFYKLID